MNSIFCIIGKNMRLYWEFNWLIGQILRIITRKSLMNLITQIVILLKQCKYFCLVSRLIKYVVHHKNVKTLLLSLIGLASFGIIAERQAGSVRYLYLMTIFSVLSSSLTVFFSILLGFSSQYSSLMYRYTILS